MQVDHKQQAEAMPKVHVSREDIKHRLMGFYPKGPIVGGEPAFGWKAMHGTPVPPGLIPTLLQVEAAFAIDELTAMLADCVFNMDLAIAALNHKRAKGSSVPDEHVASIIGKVMDSRGRAHKMIEDYYRITTEPKEE